MYSRLSHNRTINSPLKELPKLGQIKETIKNTLSALGIYVTKNQKYDALSERIFKQVLSKSSNAIDIGAHKGSILKSILKNSPEGQHIGVEPIPFLANQLKKDFPNVEIHNCALADSSGETSFQHVVSDPSYSGLKRREYKSDNVEVEEITVPVNTLDDIVPADRKVDLIKIDVEGAELLVLKGGMSVLRNSKPVVVFEHGMGASDYYDSYPGELLDLLSSVGLKVYLLEDYLSGKHPLDLKSFEAQYYNKVNHYFVASAN